MIFFYVK